MTTIFAIANQKGGVGKTTTAVTMGHGLALSGFSVLVVDLDSQGNVADSLGLPDGNDLVRLMNPLAPQPLVECITCSGRERLGVIRSDKSTVKLKKVLAGEDFKEYSLAEALDQAAHDVIILDCAPSIDILHTAALVAADFVVIPTALDQLAVKGVRDLLISITTLYKSKRSGCQLGGILPTFLDRRTNETQRQLENLYNYFKGYVWPPIPDDVHCREASRAKKTLFEYAPKTRALSGVMSANGSTAGGYLQALERMKELL